MDAKDILRLPKTPFSANSEKKPRPQKDSQRKPDGISREVYALTGGLAPLMPAIDPAHLKRKSQIDKEKVTWQWLSFTSSARKDDLKLYHWVRVVNGVPPTGDYSFAKYNKSVEVVKYTDEEYEKHLTDPVVPWALGLWKETTSGPTFAVMGNQTRGVTTQSRCLASSKYKSDWKFYKFPCFNVFNPFVNIMWTKEETDHLFELCEQFDLRFIIIADRFPSSRSVEDLKNRYYSVSRAIVIARAPSPADVSENPLVKEPYNARRETERKRALSMILSQTKQQERKDAEVLAEAKRITESRMMQKTAEQPEMPSTSTADPEFSEKTPVELSLPSNPAIQTAAVPPNSTEDVTSTPSSLRMLQAHLLGFAPVKRIEEILENVQVNVKPKVPTKNVCAEHLELRREILTLLNLRKQLQNKEPDATSHYDNSYTETPSTPKRTPRAGDQDRSFVPDSTSFGGERVGKRDKRKVSDLIYLIVYAMLLPRSIIYGLTFNCLQLWHSRLQEDFPMHLHHLLRQRGLESDHG
ncbi:hypothetical protein Syun_008124 [Stephania yunnanensis]|uniref:Myb-like domain-containing protein n=1 Tax=Stephania yunnanensis TaxID=152371 RepID=A0AAP0PZG1_9MAGN